MIKFLGTVLETKRAILDTKNTKSYVKVTFKIFSDL